MIKKIASAALATLMAGTLLTSCSQPNLENLLSFEMEKPNAYTSEVEGAALTIYVDSNVETSGDGSESAPFKTVPEAQTKIRELKAGEGLPVGGVRVLLATGEYDGLVLTEEDSGTAECPITYVSAEKLGASINSGVILDPADFTELDSAEKARLINQAEANNIKKIDLKSYGLDASDWGELGVRSTWDSAHGILDEYGVTTVPEGELYINGDRSYLAMYPNNALLDLSKFLSFGPIIENVLNMDINDPEFRGSTFTADDETFEHVKSWKNPTEVWVYGYYRWEWAEHSVPIGKIDEAAKTITLAYPCGEYLIDNYKYIFYNAFEELDCPGEYYVDRENGILYVYADKKFDSSTLVFANDATPLLSASDISYINFVGLDIRYTRGHGVSINTANHVTFDHCSIGSTRSGGFSINVGNHVTISNCEVSNIGGQAITITNGGDKETLTKSENLIYNNIVRDFGQISRTYAYGIWPGSIGTTVSHNEIYNAPHNAVSTGSMLNTIEYNEIYNVCTETQDCAAIYNGFGFTGRGNVIQYNYIHDIGQEDTHTHAIYLDSSYSGQTIYGNVFENTGYTAVKAGTGRDNVISNNIFIDCASHKMEYGALEVGHWNRDMWLSGSSMEAIVSDDFMGTKIEDLIEYDNEVWKSTFPEIYTTRFDFNPETDSKDDPAFFPNPTGHTITKNVVIINYGTGDINKNMPYILGADLEKFSTVEDNIFLQYDMSSFEGPDEKNYTVREGSKIMKLIPDFEIIPFEEIGLVD